MRDFSAYKSFTVKKNFERPLRTWIHALNYNEELQGENYLYNSEDESFCANGVLYSVVFGTPIKELDGKDFPTDAEYPDLYAYIGGLNDGGNPSGNDGDYAKLTFKEIADYLAHKVYIGDSENLKHTLYQLETMDLQALYT